VLIGMIVGDLKFILGLVLSHLRSCFLDLNLVDDDVICDRSILQLSVASRLMENMDSAKSLEWWVTTLLFELSLMI